jgi:hypothetical protein
MDKHFVEKIVTIIVLCLAFHASSGFAFPISIDITATVVSVRDDENVFDGAINIGDLITGTYLYESTTVDSNPLDTVGDYWHDTSPYGITLNTGGFVFQTDPDNVAFLVEMVHDHYTGKDHYLLRSYSNVPLSDDVVVFHISWQLDDPTQTALSSEALPTVPPVLGDWESIFGLKIMGGFPDPYGGYPDDFIIKADVSSAVLSGSAPIPEPATMLLFGTGVIGLLIFVKRRLNQKK